jgi:hypothetical protein
MSLAVYMDVHVTAAVTEGLRRKCLDVRTAQADAAGVLSDEELLLRATAVGSVLLTQDADFLEITARWQQQGIAFSGVLFAPQDTPIGRVIEDAELCLAGLVADEFRNRLVHLPLRLAPGCRQRQMIQRSPCGSSYMVTAGQSPDPADTRESRPPPRYVTCPHE